MTAVASAAEISQPAGISHKAPAAKSRRLEFWSSKAHTKKPEAETTKDEPKTSKAGFFHGFKSKKVPLDKGKGKEEEKEIVWGRPDHPAYGLPGEALPSFTDLHQPRDAAGKGKRGNLSNLLDLDGSKQPEWKPLFGDDSVDVPDAQEASGSGAADWFIEVPAAQSKAKDKTTAGKSGSVESFQSATESLSETPGELPRAYQVIAGKTANQCPHYNYASLFNGRKVRELWDSNGDTLIYLCPKNSTTSRGPSFLVSSLTLQGISDYWVAAFSPVWQGGFDIDKETYPTAKYALFFAADRPDGKHEETDPVVLLRHYVTMRNVFACIFDSYCVGLIEDESTLLSDLVDRMLMYFEGAEDNLGQKLSEFIIKSGLWDVSNDPIKAVDLLHLAHTYEMKELYEESFAHCVGMWPQITSANAHEVLASSVTSRISDRHVTMSSQVAVITTNLQKFHFKPIWSVKSPVSKLPTTVRQSFELMRTFLFKYYSNVTSSTWPPKNISTRPIFTRIYSDFCALYSLMVDKQYTSTAAATAYSSLIPFVKSLYFIDNSRACGGCGSHMPYGIPLLPGFFTQILRRQDPTVRKPEFYQWAQTHKLSDAELEALTGKMYNEFPGEGIAGDAMEAGKDILKAFIGFEKSLLKGKTVKTVIETRKGIWLMVYAVLSVMADISVEDNVVFKEGVEYFISVDLKGICTWEEGRERRDAEAARRAAEEDGEEVDRWSIASLEGTTEPDANAGREAGAAPGGEPASAAEARRMGKKRCERSFPWIVVQGPEWQGNDLGGPE
ncbi:hypothetical protein ABW19_dt0201984 [Dactylella cylindrospora]|nr:hypothetical protein ABW19_dt0201984 [Dactylella cylindrospora]